MAVRGGAAAAIPGRATLSPARRPGLALVRPRWGQPRPTWDAPLLAGLIFALHPVGVESRWRGSRREGAPFRRYSISARRSPTRRWRRWVGPSCISWPSAFSALALLSKSVTATLPAALLVVVWWKEGRLSWKREVWPLVPWFIIGAASGLFTAWVERRYIRRPGRGDRPQCLAAVRGAGGARQPGSTSAPSSRPARLDFALSAVDGERRPGRTAPLSPGAARHPGGPLGRAAAGPWSGGGGVFFVGSLFPVLGFFQRLSLRLFLCRGSFPVPGLPRHLRGRGPGMDPGGRAPTELSRAHV